MKRTWIIMILLGFSMAVSIPAVSQNLNKKQSADTAFIKQVMADLDAAYDKRDAVAYIELFQEDADFLWTTGVLSKDRNEIQQQVTNTFKVIPSEYKHISTLQRIRFITPDIAIVDGTVMFVREGAAETEEPFWKALTTGVCKKEKGQWRVSAIRLMLPPSE
ncbi:MAG: SgcJ/EcaC family oxidoreductase [Bacteroidales bacterium]